MTGSSSPVDPKIKEALLERYLASIKATGEVEQTILKSLMDYSKTVGSKMDELVSLNLPSTAEREAAEKVRKQVLDMTSQLIKNLADNLLKPPS